MKRLNAILILLVTISLASCNEKNIVTTQKGDSNDPKSLNPPITKVYIGEDHDGALTLKFDNIDGLQTELETYFSYDNVFALEVLQEGGEYWLSGKGENPSDSLHYSFAMLLHNQGDGELYLQKGDVTSQTCTSKLCCTEYQLNIVDELSGSCVCNNDDCNLPESEKKCSFSVKNMSGADTEFDNMIDKLASL